MREREREERMEGREEGGNPFAGKRSTDDGQVCEGLRLHFNTRRRRPAREAAAAACMASLAWRVVVALELCRIRVSKIRVAKYSTLLV